MEKMNRKLRPEGNQRKVAYYIRCSTEEQNESPEGTIKNQEERLLRDIENGAVDVVMVTELSRLSRSIKDFSELWEFMQTHGCQFLSLRESFDTSTAWALERRRAPHGL